MNSSFRLSLPAIIVLMAFLVSCTDDGPPTDHAVLPPDPEFWITPDTVYAEVETEVHFKLEYDEVDIFRYHVIWDCGEPDAGRVNSDNTHWYSKPGTFVVTATIVREYSLDTVAVAKAVAIIAPNPLDDASIEITTPRTVMYMLIPDTLEARLPDTEEPIFVAWYPGDGNLWTDYEAWGTSRKELTYRDFGEFTLVAEAEYRGVSVKDSMRVTVPKPTAPVACSKFEVDLGGSFTFVDTVTNTETGQTKITTSTRGNIWIPGTDLGYFNRRPWQSYRTWNVRKGIDHPTCGVRLTMSPNGDMIEDAEFWGTSWIGGATEEKVSSYIHLNNVPLQNRDYPHSALTELSGIDVAKYIVEVRVTSTATSQDGKTVIRRRLKEYKPTSYSMLRVRFGD